MQPHSAVNDSNYDSIASPVSPWVKGESHATRMRRVDNMRRISYSPSLQPEGTMSGVKNLFEGYGMGALLFTGLCGAAFGIKSGRWRPGWNSTSCWKPSSGNFGQSL